MCEACAVRNKNTPTRAEITENEQEYECSRCYHRGNRLEFQKKHWEQDKKRGTQQCVACTNGTRGGLQCGVQKCKKFVCERALSASDRKNSTRKGEFVCETCLEVGYTAKIRRPTHAPAAKKRQEEGCYSRAEILSEH